MPDGAGTSGPFESKGYTDNVVDLMVGKLSRLPRTTLGALRTLACLGNTGDTSTLALVHGTSEEQLHSDLWEALRLELIVRSDDSYRFVHDRVQEAAYSLIPEAQRATEHLRIGRLLTTQIPPDKREDAVFEIVGHFNRATALITSPDEREQVAALNLLAGKRAKKAAAFASALSLSDHRRGIAGKDGRQRHDLVFELELHRAECEFLTGDVASAEQRLRMLSSARSQRDRAVRGGVHPGQCLYRARRARPRAVGGLWNACGKPGSIFRCARRRRRRALPTTGSCSRLDGVGLDEVAALPMMTDPASRAILEVLAALHWCAGAAAHKLSEVLIVCAAVDLVLDRGIHDGCVLGVRAPGIPGRVVLRRLRRALHFGRLGYELIERTGLRRFEGLVCLHVSTLVMPWARHATQCRPVIRRTFEVADNTGNRFLAVAGGNILLSNLLLAGDPLVEVAREAEGLPGVLPNGQLR